MSKGLFITGTDTGIGKTLIANALLHKFNYYGLKTIGIKPLATGCDETAQGLRNDDAIKLAASASLKLPYEHINPVAFKPAIAPQIAAEEQGVKLSVVALKQSCQPALGQQADMAVIEGMGGWEVPLNDEETQADFAKTLGFPVIMVVGLRLGCLNHALLTRAAIKRTGIPIAGWVANCLFPTMPYQEENLATLKQKFKEPLLGCIPYLETVDPVWIAKKLKLAKEYYLTPELL